MKKHKVTSLTNTSRLFYLFIAPWLIGFCVFTFFPMVFSLFTSFTSWNGLSVPEFIGFKNYVNILTKDTMFISSLLKTLYYVGVSVPLNIIFSIILALLLNKRLPGSNVFRSIFYLPTICSGVALYIAWLYLYNQNSGFINVLLSFIGIEGPGWLTNIDLAMPSIIFMGMFTIGTSMTIVLAGLQNVPHSYYEAADLDGAGAFYKFKNITFPMISPVIFFNLLMALIKGLQVFTQPYVMTEGGPANATYVYGLHLYKSAFLYSKFGYASALAWVLFIILIALSIAIFATSKFWVFYREDVN
ncbi:MAG: sugar ABC transporter permease [Oscillospiraceae bacterium]|nr:sugar ABC transporter permease [Oscillospiraceae bacterium]